MTDDLIEKVARAIYRTRYPADVHKNWSMCEAEAMAAIAAARPGIEAERDRKVLEAVNRALDRRIGCVETARNYMAYIRGEIADSISDDVKEGR